MTPSAIDLLFLTFNCAKSIIDTSVFGHHLQDVLGQNATALPELVVLLVFPSPLFRVDRLTACDSSLQEIAPMSYAFIGEMFLSNYVGRFGEALNAAACRVSGNDASECQGERSEAQYTLIAFKNVGYTAIALFSRQPDRVQDTTYAEVGFGAADMGNKGAVGIRIRYQTGPSCTVLTFVAAHLAAMEWNLSKRNANWAAIMRGMTFGNPSQLLNQLELSTSEILDNEPDERQGLLGSVDQRTEDRVRQSLQEMSIFHPSSHLFVGGDLNYRISSRPPTPGSAFPSLDENSPNYYPKFFHLDQLTKERQAGRTFHGLQEQKVDFPPTYKYEPSAQLSTGHGSVRNRDWKFAPHRYPSWTDRILFLDLPLWAKHASPSAKIEVLAYDCMPVMHTSDHRPVFLRVRVPALDSTQAWAPEAEYEQMEALYSDPRARPPIEIDPEAWERRKSARRREIWLGWSMLLWSTKEGCLFIVTAVASAFLLYWFRVA